MDFTMNACSSDQPPLGDMGIIASYFARFPRSRPRIVGTGQVKVAP
jgi:hypothetical protein